MPIPSHERSDVMVRKKKTTTKKVCAQIDDHNHVRETITFRITFYLGKYPEINVAVSSGKSESSVLCDVLCYNVLGSECLLVHVHVNVCTTLQLFNVGKTNFPKRYTQDWKQKENVAIYDSHS